MCRRLRNLQGDHSEENLRRQSVATGERSKENIVEGAEMTDLYSLLKSQWKRLALVTPILLIAGYFGLLYFSFAMQGRLVYVW